MRGPPCLLGNSKSRSRLKVISPDTLCAMHFAVARQSDPRRNMGQTRLMAGTVDASAKTRISLTKGVNTYMTFVSYIHGSLPIHGTTRRRRLRSEKESREKGFFKVRDLKPLVPLSSKESLAGTGKKTAEDFLQQEVTSKVCMCAIETKTPAF